MSRCAHATRTLLYSQPKHRPNIFDYDVDCIGMRNYVSRALCNFRYQDDQKFFEKMSKLEVDVSTLPVTREEIESVLPTLRFSNTVNRKQLKDLHSLFIVLKKMGNL